MIHHLICRSTMLKDISDTFWGLLLHDVLPFALAVAMLIAIGGAFALGGAILDRVQLRRYRAAVRRIAESRRQ